jgi:hypothetical protein
MSRILVEYCPELSAKALRSIAYDVTPSMTSEDGSSNQYQMDMVAESLEAAELIDDLKIIDGLIEEGVHYIEF